MRSISYDKLSNKCINIIKNNPPKEAINLISNLKTEDNNIIGKETAKKIYKLYSNYSVKYSSTKYSENITKYTNKVNNNIKKACGKNSLSDSTNKFNII